MFFFDPKHILVLIIVLVVNFSLLYLTKKNFLKIFLIKILNFTIDALLIFPYLLYFFAKLKKKKKYSFFLKNINLNDFSKPYDKLR